MKKKILPFICGVVIWWVGYFCCLCAYAVFTGKMIDNPNAAYYIQILCAVLFLAGVVGYYGVKITTLLKDIRDGKKGDDLDDEDEDDGGNLN